MPLAARVDEQYYVLARMANDRILEDTVTKFFLTTCNLHRPVNENHAHIFQQYMEMVIKEYSRADGIEYSYIPLITGSIAELFIQPILSCVGDVDVMCHRSNQVAIPAGYTPPRQLPGDFGRRVELYEISDSQFPGYVYLWLSYFLTECVDDGKYSAVRCQRLPATNGSSDADVSRHGPALVKNELAGSGVVALALKLFGVHHAVPDRSVDSVFCMRCLVWPSQATGWPKRQRNQGWPDSATVDRVVSNGCDVVGVARRQCRQDEWMRKYQWRLSFSRAEIVLLNNWMSMQQIVYHMLRVFIKTERLTDSAAAKSEADSLSNYHIKTLMLWACELKPRSWWTDDPNLVKICVELLHTLAVWLTDLRCQHYFINYCNLFGHFEKMRYTEVPVTADRLMSISREWFCKWCINSYIHKCAELCPTSVSSLLLEASTRTPNDRLHCAMCLQNAIPALVNWRLDQSQKLAVIHFLWFQLSLQPLSSYQCRWSRILGPVSFLSCMSGPIFSLWTSLEGKVHKGFFLCFTAALFLHVAYETKQGSLTDEMLDALATACLQLNDARGSLNARRSSLLSLSQASVLMKIVAYYPHSIVHQIETELSKAYLHRALRYKDSDCKSIYCLANIYLAVLYYTTRQYHTALDHCTLVTRLQDHSHCSSYVIQGELLPRIDDQVDNVIGLSVLYQYIQAAALNEEQERRYVSVFTTELFAHYLNIKFLSVTQCHQLPQTSDDEHQRYWKCLYISQALFVTDVALFHLSYRIKCPSDYGLLTADRSETKSSVHQELDTSKLSELLVQSAVERLTLCRELEARDLMASVITPDAEALYAYKCGQYQHCLHLSVRNVCQLIVNKYQFCLFVFLFPFHELIQLIDDEIVSIVGLAMLINRSYNSVTRQPSAVVVHQLTLSLYLLTQCQIKLRHSVTSLTRTLDYVRLARRVARQPWKYVFDCFIKNSRVSFDRPVLQLLEQRISRYISDSAT